VRVCTPANVEQKDAAARVMAGRSEGFPGDAHALLVAIYRNESLPLSMRLDAAKSAVKFERPALATTVLTQRTGLEALSLDELQQLLALAEVAAAQPAVIGQETTGLPI
jgi:hypothetical protein